MSGDGCRLSTSLVPIVDAAINAAPLGALCTLAFKNWWRKESLEVAFPDPLQVPTDGIKQYCSETG